MTTPITAIGLTVSQALAILNDEQLRASWARSTADFAVIGTDDPDDPNQELDPTLLATALGGHGGPPTLIAGSTRDLPYNLSRRVLSADHFNQAGSGVVLGFRDYGGYAEGPTENPTMDSDEFTDTLISLWQSWPLDSVIADRDSGVLVRSDQIRLANHGGVAGPLSLPSSRQGTPVVAWYATDGTPAPTHADLVITRVPGTFTQPQLIEVTVKGDATRAKQEALSLGANGVLLVSSSVEDLLDASPVAQPTGTLRQILRLPAPPLLIATNPPAFPTPTSAVYA